MESELGLLLLLVHYLQYWPVNLGRYHLHTTLGKLERKRVETIHRPRKGNTHFYFGEEFTKQTHLQPCRNTF